MDVYYTENAKRQLKKLETNIQERIVDKNTLLRLAI